MEDEINFPIPDGFKGLAGKTDALNEEHIVARDSLLELLHEYEPWQQLLSDLFTEIEQDPAITDPFSTDHAEIVVRRMVSFVKEQLRLPWAWVAFDLLEVFYATLATLARGENTFTRTLWLKPISSLAPEVRLNFYSEEGRSALDVLAELDAHIAEARAIRNVIEELIGKPARGRGRPRDATPMYVQWYFRHHVEGEPVSKIASEEGRDTSDIYKGIGEALGLLGIAAQFWDDIEDNDPAIVKAARFWASDEKGGN